MRTLKTTPSTRLDHLSRSPLFEGLARADLAALAKMAVTREYDRGESLFLFGDDADGFYLLVEGRVKLSRFGPDGREQVVHLLGPGQPCGEVPVFEGGTFPATAEALSPLTALFVSRRAFLSLAANHPQVLLSMLAILSRRLRGLVELVDDLSLKEVSARLARYLLDLSAEKESTSFKLDTDKRTLASRLGTIAETLSRTFHRLQDQGLISVKGRCVSLLNGDGLTALAEGHALTPPRPKH
jgi:CRP-like cAMP-binding protein